MDQRLFRVRRNGVNYEVVECIIYDSGHCHEEGVVFFHTERYVADKEADRLNKGAENGSHSSD
jgi:hypothetical protein